MTDIKIEAAHAVLSPSSSDRWISCPASVGLIERLNLPEEEDSPYALEGTSAHEIAEIEASYAFGHTGLGPYLQRKKVWRDEAKDTGYDTEGMIEHAKEWVELLRGFQEEIPLSHVMLEQRLPTGVPECWGTSDGVVAGPTRIHVADYKYGQGVPVYAENNSQLMLYGVGALDEFSILGDIEEVVLTIHQPRLGNISSWTISADDLRAWRDSIIPIAEDALAGSDDYGPSFSVCRWCPAAGICRAQMESATAHDFESDPDILEPAEIGLLLEEIPEIRAWCNALERVALQKAYSEKVPIPGWKVVRSGGVRKIVDPSAAIQAFIDMGYKAEQVAKIGTKPLGDLEKLLKSRGKNVTLESVLGALIKKTDGSESLVRESDKRESIDAVSEAAKDFTD